MNQRVSWKHVILVFSFLIVFISISFWSLSWSEELYRVLLSEEGFVETISALGYFLCIGLLFYMAGKSSLKNYWYVYLIFLAMGLRELDFDKRFTATGIFKSKFILANDVSVLEKFVGIAVILLILYSVYILVIRHSKAFLKGLAALNLRSYVVFLALAIAVISKTLDGLARKLISFGIYIDDSLSIFTSCLEEILELGIPLAFLYAIYLYFYDRRRSGSNLI